MEGPRRVFRSSFRVLWRWTTIFCGILGAFSYVAALMSGSPLPFASTAALTLLIGAIFAVAVVCFPVYVSPEGIRCYNYFGLYSTVPWDAVKRIRRESVFGLRYLAVSSSVGWTDIYIPLYLSDMAGFIGVVREYGGDDHPLLVALEANRA